MNSPIDITIGSHEIGLGERQICRRREHVALRAPGTRISRKNNAGTIFPARHIHQRDPGKRSAFVPGATNVHQDGPTALRRCTIGVVGGDCVLPDNVARWLCLRTC
jgi:hypothetical protein